MNHTSHRYCVGSLTLGSVITAIGCGVAFFVFIMPLTRREHSRDWVETPAQISHLYLREDSWTDGISYSLEIRYHYEFNERAYTSERIGIALHSQAPVNYRRFIPAFNANQPVTCYVNLRNPAEAFIDRSIDFETFFWVNFFFVILFLQIGLWVMLSAFDKRPDPDARQFPFRANLCAPLIPAGVVFAHTLFCLYTIRDLYPWPWFVWFLFLLPAAPVFYCMRRIFTKVLFHGVRLELARVVPLGETLSASLHVPGKIESPIPARLVCLRTTTTECGDDSKTVTVPAWQGAALATPCHDGRATTFCFRLEPPSTQPATSANTKVNPCIAWQIRAEVKRFGFTHTLAFDIHLRQLLHP